MNPYEPLTDSTRQTRLGSRHATHFLLATTLSCVAIFLLSTIDQSRESCGPSVTLSLFASSPVFPALLLLAFNKKSRSGIWIACLCTTAVVACSGLFMHTIYAIEPSPRKYPDSVGQVHIFIIPVVHWLVALISYAVFGFACCLAYQNDKAMLIE